MFSIWSYGDGMNDLSGLSREEIGTVAQSAGFPASSIPIAVAVALAESSGNPRAHNPVPPDDSYGLWQINMIGRLGPERRRQFGLSRNEELLDPLTNARAAYAVSSHGTNWRPWATYTSGQYRRYLRGQPERPTIDLPRQVPTVQPVPAPTSPTLPTPDPTLSTQQDGESKAPLLLAVAIGGFILLSA